MAVRLDGNQESAHHLGIGEYVAPGPKWSGRDTFECRLCPAGFLRELSLDRIVAHLEKDHKVLLGEREVESPILGPDVNPARKIVGASVFEAPG